MSRVICHRGIFVSASRLYLNLWSARLYFNARNRW